jgi:MFS family permease
VVITIATMMVLGLGFHPTSLFGFPMGSMEVLGVLMMVSGIGLGMNLPPSNNACIELMPEKVSTITGLRGMFRSMGGILGISVVTLILHLSPNSATGFTLAFFSFGLLLLFALPLIFMMPSGKQKRSPSV